MLYMLDTDTASYIIRGGSPAIEKRLAGIPPRNVCISAISRAELMYGLKRVPASHSLHALVQRFLTMMDVLPWDAAAAGHYAEVRHQLAQARKPLGELDAMIAAHALAADAILVTNNRKHFARTKAPLRLETWSRR